MSWLAPGWPEPVWPVLRIFPRRPRVAREIPFGQLRGQLCYTKGVRVRAPDVWCSCVVCWLYDDVVYDYDANIECYEALATGVRFRGRADEDRLSVFFFVCVTLLLSAYAMCVCLCVCVLERDVVSRMSVTDFIFPWISISDTKTGRDYAKNLQPNDEKLDKRTAGGHREWPRRVEKGRKRTANISATTTLFHPRGGRRVCKCLPQWHTSHVNE